MDLADIYITRRDELIQSKVVEVAQSHKDRDAEFVTSNWTLLQTDLFFFSALRRLNLPASLEALERPVGLPPSLLAKAEEVRLENGPDAIETSLDGVERLAQRDYTILNEVKLVRTLCDIMATTFPSGHGHSRWRSVRRRGRSKDLNR